VDPGSIPVRRRGRLDIDRHGRRDRDTWDGVSSDVFNPPYWLNWFHLSFGMVVLRIAIAGDQKLQNGFTLVAFVMGTTLGLAGMPFGSYVALRYDMPQLADSSDPIAHLAVGMLALAALWNRKGSGDRRRSSL
jgi:hypothetical protein